MKTLSRWTTDSAYGVRTFIPSSLYGGVYGRRAMPNRNERPYSHYIPCPSAKAYRSPVNNKCHRSNGKLGFRNHACQPLSFLTGEVGILGSSITQPCPPALVVMPSVGSYIVQIISSSDFSYKLDGLLNLVEGVWVLAVCRGVVGNHRFTLGYWLTLEVRFPLGARIYCGIAEPGDDWAIPGGFTQGKLTG